MIRRLSLLAFALLGSQAAFAGVPIEMANNQVSLSAVQQNFRYHEVDNYGATQGGWLDSETGSQQGAGLRLAMQGDFASVHDVYFTLEGTAIRGNTNYDGYLQGGSALIPYKTTTKYKTTDYQLKLGKAFTLGNASQFQLTPYGTFGSYDWLRDSSKDPYGYAERYKNQFYGVGLLMQAEINNRLIVSLDLMEGRTLSSKMTLTADGTQFKLGAKPMSSISLGADYALDKNWRLGAEYRQTYFKYGESPVVNQMLEPNSETTRDQYRLSVGYSFR